MTKYLLPLALLLIFIGCSKKYNPANTPFAIYHPIPEDSVRKLEKGVTTATGVVNLFGQPAKNSISHRGERYTYGYLGDTLVVDIDSTQTVGSFVYHPAVFEPVSGNANNTNRSIKESKVNKIKIYNTHRRELDKWFKPANKKETNQLRNRYTFNRRNGTLVVYTLNNYEERVLSYSYLPK